MGRKKKEDTEKSDIAKKLVKVNKKPKKTNTRATKAEERLDEAKAKEAVDEEPMQTHSDMTRQAFDDFIKQRSHNIKVNPRQIAVVIKDLKGVTLRNYRRNWLEYIRYSKIGPCNLPSESNFYAFLQYKRETKKNKASTLTSTLSSLKYFVSRMYTNIDVDKMPTLNTYISKCADGETIRQAAPISQDAFTEMVVGTFKHIIQSSLITKRVL